MKYVLVVLAAAVVAGLGCYALFSANRAFVLVGTSVTVNVEVFVGFIASLTILSAALAVLFQVVASRGEDRLLRRLERRIEQLEAAAKSAPARERW